MEEIAQTPPKKIIPEKKMVQPLEPKKERRMPKFVLPLIVVLVVVFGGVLTGYWLAGRGGGGLGLTSGLEMAPGTEMKGKEFGSTDVSAFPDTAVGVIQKGGINGEGTHHLVREGGESQTAYLTSSVINLDPLVGKKVQVWGETFQGQKAAWLMDVGRVKVLD